MKKLNNDFFKIFCIICIVIFIIVFLIIHTDSVNGLDELEDNSVCNHEWYILKMKPTNYDCYNVYCPICKTALTISRYNWEIYNINKKYQQSKGRVI